jgi:hypothetical protein
MVESLNCLYYDDIHRPNGVRVRATVAELAGAEPLLALPVVAHPATIEVVRPVAPNATVAFRGNGYSVGPRSTSAFSAESS